MVDEALAPCSNRRFFTERFSCVVGGRPKKTETTSQSLVPRSKNRYPEWIDCKDINEFKETISKLGTLIGGTSAFETNDAYTSVQELLSRERLDVSIDDFMACIAVVLSGTEVTLPFNVTGKIELSVSPYSVWPAEPKTTSPGRKMFMSFPFGIL